MEQIIENRPKCIVEGCNCVVRRRPKNKSGLVRYYSMCQKHQDAPNNTIGRFTFDVLTKEQTIEIIKKVRSAYGL